MNELISALGRLPGIGRKSAQRLAFHLLDLPAKEVTALAEIIVKAKTQTKRCPICCNLTEFETCEICHSSKRDASLVCVVESPRDVAIMEQTNEYQGRYHVLYGNLDPLQNIGPEKLTLQQLFRRLQSDQEIAEVILANGATMEGEATALYVAKLLEGTGIRCTRIAHGLPYGSNLEFADKATLAKALAGRIVVSDS